MLDTVQKPLKEHWNKSTPARNRSGFWILNLLLSSSWDRKKELSTFGTYHWRCKTDEPQSLIEWLSLQSDPLCLEERDVIPLTFQMSLSITSVLIPGHRNKWQCHFAIICLNTGCGLHSRCSLWQSDMLDVLGGFQTWCLSYHPYKWLANPWGCHI